MPCYHPITAYQSTSNLSIDRQPIFDEKTAIQKFGLHNYQKIQIPCKVCKGCRLEYSRSWAVRMMLETKYWSNNVFLTLTYSSDPEEEAHIKGLNGSRINTETGELETPLCLYPDDLKPFWDRLRKYIEYHYGEKTKIKYYQCGEYGSENQRPHYHAIVYGLPDDMIKMPWHTNKHGNMIYIMPEIEKEWGHGLVGVGDVSFESCCYVARYMMKKHKGKDGKEYYDNLALTPEFNTTSNGIGLAYFEGNSEQIYNDDAIWITSYAGKQIKCRPPKYYDDKFDIMENRERMIEIKQKRQHNAEQNKKIKLSHTSLTEEQQNQIEEHQLEDKIKKLKREI